MRLVKVMCWMSAFVILLHLNLPARSQTNDSNAPATNAQTPNPSATSPPATNAPTAGSPSSPAPEQTLLKPGELDALVAPIALYPDPLLANVLMASTYPLEVVQAQRWVTQNKNLKPDALKTAAEKQDWDSSVKALIVAPSVLQTMDEHLDWTEKLGEAFLAQQQDVMDAVQRMRAKAYDRKKLVTTKQQVVTVKQEQNRQVIAIDPATTDTLYVPYYEPQVVFGDWPYADYPAYPYYWGYPGYIAAGVIATGLVFGAGYALGRWATGGYWGSGGWWGGSRVNWGGGAIDINRGGRVEHWQHNPAHRGGARYNNANLQQRFGNANRQGPGGGANRPNVGDRAQRTDRGGGARGGADRGRAAADRGNANRQAGAGRSSGNRQAANRNRSAGARQGRPAGRPSGHTASRAGNFRPAAGPGRGGGARFAGGGGHRAGGFRGGGGGGMRGGGGRGGGRRSDIRLKHDVVWLGRLDNGLGYYRFAYNGSDKAYVGVIAQEVQTMRPDAVSRGADGYLRVSYKRLGLHFQTYHDWTASGGRLPTATAP
jgi:Protein of unknown function (DUF3300)